MNKTAKIILIRHGECVDKFILRGQTNSKLSDFGWKQMKNATDNLVKQGLTPKVIISSPLDRCQQFATQIATQLEVPVSIEPQLAEINYGDWDGVSFDEIYSKDAKSMEQFFLNPWQYSAPNGEAMTDFEQRVNKAYDKLCLLASPFTLRIKSELKLRHEQSNCLWVFTHGGVIKQIICYILSLQKQASIFTNIDIQYGAVMQINLCWDKDICYSRLIF